MLHLALDSQLEYILQKQLMEWPSTRRSPDRIELKFCPLLWNPPSLIPITDNALIDAVTQVLLWDQLHIFSLSLLPCICQELSFFAQAPSFLLGTPTEGSNSVCTSPVFRLRQIDYCLK